MKRLFISETGRVEVREVPDLEIGEDEILVKIKACSICGGDIKIYKGIKKGVLKKDLPHPLNGHEWSGEIVKVGSNISDFKVGDRVARCFNNYCGFCINCRLGMPNFCVGIKQQEHSGGFAEFAKFYIPPNGGKGLFKIPEEIVNNEILEPLANVKRLQILKSLLIKERTFSELMQITGLQGGNLLFHLQKLLSAGVIIQRHERGDYMITEKGYKILKSIAELYLDIANKAS
ncbi:MAG: alcohol dehydrogenase catalytic domain-containing protein [Candidatus Bathyarchaeia archaeon]